MIQVASPSQVDSHILVSRAREQYAASLAALANVSSTAGKSAPLALSDLPEDLARLVGDHLRTRPRQKLVLLSYQQFVDGRLQTVIGDCTVLPDGAEFVSLSRSLTLVATHGTHAVVDLFVGRVESAPPAVSNKVQRGTKRRASVKRTRSRRKATARGRNHA